MLLAVEDIVGADINTASVDLQAGARNVQCANGVDGKGLRRMILAIIDTDIGRAIDDKLWARLKYRSANCDGIGAIGILMG